MEAKSTIFAHDSGLLGQQNTKKDHVLFSNILRVRLL